MDIKFAPAGVMPEEPEKIAHQTAQAIGQSKLIDVVVDVAPMCDSHHENHQSLVFNLVNDSVITDSNSQHWFVRDQTSRF